MSGVSSEVIDSYENYPSGQDSVVCLGNFDGLHQGHIEILKNCLLEARRQQLKSIVFTFKPHPMKVVLGEERSPRLLISYAQKRELLMRVGFDYVLEQEFTPEFSKMSAEDFAKNVLGEKLSAKSVIVGDNFHHLLLFQ